MILEGNMIIQCLSCGTEHNIDKDYLDYDSSDLGEFGMGHRVQHDFSGESVCDRCGQLMSFNLFGYEYPVGAKEYQDRETNGCKIIEEPTIIFEDIPEPVLTVFQYIFLYPDTIYNLNPCEFERFVAEVFQSHGFNAEVTQRTRDGGVDIVASFEMGGILYRTYFECKHYRPDRSVGVSMVRALYGVLERDRIDKGVLVTTSRFTRDAVKEAEMLNGRIQLVDYQELRRLMRIKLV